MKTSMLEAVTACVSDGDAIIRWESGVEIRFPIIENPRLAMGTKKQLNNIEISRLGVHWPELDEDLSFAGLLKGDYGQNLSGRLSQRACR